MSKCKVWRTCDVNVKGDEKFRLSVNEAVDKFLELLDRLHDKGYLKEVNLHVYYNVEVLDNE